MNVWVYGAGSVGGYYGGRLVQTGMNYNVLFIARGENKKVLQSRGLELISKVEGNIKFNKINVCDEDELVGVKELPACILVCTKSFSNQGVISKLKKALPGYSSLKPEEKPTIIVLQNGLSSHVAFEKEFGRENVLPSVVGTALELVSPGVVVMEGRSLLTVKNHPRAVQLATAFNKLKCKTECVDDIEKYIWRKLTWNVPINSITALTGLVAKNLIADQTGQQLIRAMTAEVVALSAYTTRKDIFPPNFTEERMKKITVGAGASFSHASSTLQDVKNGKSIEYSILGDLVEFATEKNCLSQIPFISLAYSLLVLTEKGYKQPKL
eukprot:c39428_g1_i1.p1 GENE.c39428_g1_i1~~c39428_g1_i1.p1  ORF type:complete len:325 (+),score=-10.75 c39428_g1_i1:78-1052(+)